MQGADNRITANSETLMRQGPMTADEYFREAIERIDRTLGNGYAAQHPELIAAFMNASALDFGASVMARAIEAVADSVDRVANAVADLH